MPRSRVSPMSATVATRSRRQTSAAVPAMRRTAPAIKSHAVGGAIQARAQIPEANAAASGARGAAGQTNLLAHGDELAQRCQLPRPEAEHAPEPVGGVEAAAPLAHAEPHEQDSREEEEEPELRARIGHRALSLPPVLRRF